MGTQEEDQEGTSVERRDQERPEGSNTPSRPEREDISCPFVTDMAPPHVVAEMQMMKERMDFIMNTCCPTSRLGVQVLCSFLLKETRLNV